ncbi:MAG: hypothetical protein AAF329_27645, partial [Cyanobacteria bacterium P01_A01_bin.17]
KKHNRDKFVISKDSSSQAEEFSNQIYEDLNHLEDRVARNFSRLCGFLYYFVFVPLIISAIYISLKSLITSKNLTFKDELELALMLLGALSFVANVTLQIVFVGGWSIDPRGFIKACKAWKKERLVQNRKFIVNSPDS